MSFVANHGKIIGGSRAIILAEAEVEIFVSDTEMMSEKVGGG